MNPTDTSAVVETPAVQPAENGDALAVLAKKLDELARLRDLKASPYQLLAAALKKEMPEMADSIAAVIEQHEIGMVEMAETISRLEAEIKVKVMAGGFDVAGSMYRAIITPGRVSWSTRGLEKYSAGHPEVKKFRKAGNAFVTIAPVRTMLNL